MAKRNIWGHLALAAAYIIFGVNIVTTKDVSNSGIIPPQVLFTMRALGASTLFWLISLFLPKEKIPLSDLWKIALASILGLFIPQFTFLEAVPQATPIDVGVFGTLGPVFTMIFAYFFVHEPITAKKVAGVAVSLAGILFLIFNSTHSGGASHTTPLGMLLLLVNSISFSLYLGIFRPLIQKYSVVTFMKWSFLCSLILSLPLSLHGALTTDFSLLTPKHWSDIFILVVFATCVSYFLIPYGQKSVKPTVVSMYNYLQPIFAALVGVATGLDTITWQKVVAILLVFVGVGLVNRSKGAADPR